MRFQLLLALVVALAIDNVLGAPLNYRLSGALPKKYSNVQLTSSYGPSENVTPYDQDSVVPATPPEEVLIVPRGKLPSIASLKQKMKVLPNNILFYAGPGKYQATAAKVAHERNLKILKDTWHDPKYAKGKGKGFFDCASQALAESCKGTAYVLLPSDTTGTKWHKGTTWDRIEHPALVKNPDVTKIIRLKENDKDSQEVIHPSSQTPAGESAHAGKAVTAGGKPEGKHKPVVKP